jgi:hypothetical protein
MCTVIDNTTTPLKQYYQKVIAILIYWLGMKEARVSRKSFEALLDLNRVADCSPAFSALRLIHILKNSPAIGKRLASVLMPASNKEIDSRGCLSLATAAPLAASAASWKRTVAEESHSGCNTTSVRPMRREGRIDARRGWGQGSLSVG